MAFDHAWHVMLSYNWNSQGIVSKIYGLLKAQNIPVWFNIEGGMKDNIYKRYKLQGSRNDVLYA
jgi:hypothetical protein